MSTTKRGGGTIRNDDVAFEVDVAPPHGQRLADPDTRPEHERHDVR
ncbi:hypothetical protein WEH80_36085 [Actinomycetes bacterium KLBMP 9759]